MPVLNAKLMNEKLKRGWTADDFARHLNMCSKEEFLASLQKQFNSKAYNGWCSEMRGNQKRKDKIERSRAQESEKEEEMETMMEVEVKAEKESVEENKVLELKMREESIRKEICDKELDHVQLKAKRRELYTSLRKQKEALLRLKEEMKERQEEVNEIVTQLQVSASEMSKISAEISNSQKELEKVREEIKSLQKIEIFAYKNGEIEAEKEGEKFEIEISDSWEELFKDLATKDLLEDLTVKQIKQIAKLIVLTESLQQQNMKFEITFEMEEVRNLFHQLQQ